MLGQMTKFHTFSRLSRLPLCICISQLLYLFLCWWTLRLLPHPGTYKECFYEIGVHASLWTSVIVLFRYIPSYGSAHRSHGSSVFNILRTFHVVLHSGCSNLDSPNSVRVFPFSHILTNISEKATAPTPVLLPGKSHGRRSLVGCSPRGCWESDTTERLHFDFSLSCIGEGNGNPFQCSCLENPMDRGACWAAVYGDAQSRTRLKRLSSSYRETPLLLCLSTRHWKC